MLEARVFVEKRAYPRVPVQIRVKYRLVTEPREVERILMRRDGDRDALTGDLSLGGMFIMAGHELKAGNILRLYISLKDKSKMLAPVAEVVWFNGESGGLRFVSMRREEKEMLREFLELAEG
jgi:hypothetical protein